MNIKQLSKLWVASLCALFACWLPQSLSKPHEISFGPVSHVGAVQAISTPKVGLASYLSAVSVPAPIQAPVVQPVATVTNCGSDAQMAVIYQKESGCSTGAHNPGGCRGLGQACPGSKLPCSDYDWTCQDSWFKNYALQAYGSVAAAYAFRISHNWW